MENTAEKIAEMFNNDGQCWESRDGKSIEDVCHELGGSLCGDRSVSDSSRYWEFDDGSVIYILNGEAWDTEDVNGYWG